jgi:hypothetical protein
MAADIGTGAAPQTWKPCDREQKMFASLPPHMHGGTYNDST